MREGLGGGKRGHVRGKSIDCRDSPGLTPPALSLPLLGSSCSIWRPPPTNIEHGVPGSSLFPTRHHLPPTVATAATVITSSLVLRRSSQSEQDRSVQSPPSRRDNLDEWKLPPISLRVRLSPAEKLRLERSSRPSRERRASNPSSKLTISTFFNHQQYLKIGPRF